MTLVAMTQRMFHAEGDELREGLDTRWRAFLRICGITALPLPNDPEMAITVVEHVSPAGILLTGGDDLQHLGGTAIERENTEIALYEWATTRGLPMHGVCRGMQFLLHRTGVRLETVDGHAGTYHGLDGSDRAVNSYHVFGARQVEDLWRVTARSGDVIEAVEHRRAPISATMWHPERESPADPADVHLFRTRFGAVR